MERYAKIVATIGPASCHANTLEELRQAGMNAARINLSHGDHLSHAKTIASIRQLDPNFPILLDTKGPEIRTGQMQNNPLHVQRGDEISMVGKPAGTADATIFTGYPYLHEILPGTRILFDDGLVESEVVEIQGDRLRIRVMNDGPIGTGKKVTIQNHRVKLPFLTEKDKADVLFAIENRVFLIAASFVRGAADIQSLRSFFAANGCPKVMIISKIEHSDAVANLQEILDHSDGIMVARGDLGVALPLEEVPGIQERIIQRCNLRGKPVIVATQMLESMRENPRPTRAEVNDVAHAIMQGADGVMLSAETATGRYPIRAVETMDRIARQYEKRVSGIVRKHRRREERGQTEVAQFIAKAAFYASDELNAKAILAPTESGFTARNISRCKPKCPILAITKEPMVVQFLHLVWGVSPMLDAGASLDLNHYEMSYQIVRRYHESGILSLDDRVIITSGSNLITKRGTNLLEVYTVADMIRDRESISA